MRTIGDWWRHRRRWRHCFHHNPHTKDSWIKSALIDTGMRKMFWCVKCQRTWFV